MPRPASMPPVYTPKQLVPPLESVVELTEALWAFAYASADLPDAVVAREIKVLEPFCRFADARLRVLLLLEMSQVDPQVIKGWDLECVQGMRLAVATLERLAADWGWMPLLKTAVSRDAYIQDRRLNFGEDVLDPLYDCAVSWYAAAARMWVPPEVIATAKQALREASQDGFERPPTMTAEEARDKYRELAERRDSTPMLGTVRPAVSPQALQDMLNAHMALKMGFIAAGIAMFETPSDFLGTPLEGRSTFHPAQSPQAQTVGIGRLKAHLPAKGDPFLTLDGRPVLPATPAVVHFIAELLDARGRVVSFAGWLSANPKWEGARTRDLKPPKLAPEVYELIGGRQKGGKLHLKPEAFDAPPG